MRLLVLISFSLLIAGCGGAAKKADNSQDSAAEKSSGKNSSTKMDPGKVQTTKSGSVTQMTTICEQSDDKRTIEIVSEGKGCVLFYTKFGERKEIASGTWNTEHCEKVRDQMVGNLEAGTFNCSAAK